MILDLPGTDKHPLRLTSCLPPASRRRPSRRKRIENGPGHITHSSEMVAATYAVGSGVWKPAVYVTFGGLPPQTSIRFPPGDMPRLPARRRDNTSAARTYQPTSPASAETSGLSPAARTQMEGRRGSSCSRVGDRRGRMCLPASQGRGDPGDAGLPACGARDRVPDTTLENQSSPLTRRTQWQPAIQDRPAHRQIAAEDCSTRIA